VKVIVLGAGVIGTACAWYLAKAGHQVTVVERQDGAGLETSFANGGQISACHAEPWANPSLVGKLAKWLGRDDAPLVFRWNRWDPALWAWGLRFLANCPSGRAAVNLERTLRLALYSRQCLGALRAETGIDYDQRRLGILHVYRDPRELEHARVTARQMRDLGLAREDRDPAACVAIEPALAAVERQLAGGIFTPDDESGDAHKFTQGLAALAIAKGAEFLTGRTINGFEHQGGRLRAVATDRGRLEADAVVMALGSYSPKLAHHLGLRLPIVPAKGYSITLPVEGHAGAPTVSITDDEHKLVFSRLGERLRVAGTAEMAGWNPDLTERWRVVLEHAQRLFPDGGDYAQAEPWAGLRPVTPDSVPILGATPIANLWLATGHGTLGWTMACGTGAVIADLVSGRAPAIDMAGLGLDRF